MFVISLFFAIVLIINILLSLLTIKISVLKLKSLNIKANFFFVFKCYQIKNQYENVIIKRFRIDYDDEYENFHFNIYYIDYDII